MSEIETRSPSQFQLITPEKLQELTKLPKSRRYLASNLIINLFGQIIDPDTVRHGEPYVPKGFENNPFHVGYQESELIGSVLDRPETSSRLVIGREEVKDPGSDLSQRDSQYALLFLCPVSLQNVLEADSWGVVDKVDRMRLLASLHVTAKDYLNRLNRKIRTIEPSIGLTGEEHWTTMGNFFFDNYEHPAYPNTNRNNAVVLEVLGQVAQLYRRHIFNPNGRYVSVLRNGNPLKTPES